MYFPSRLIAGITMLVCFAMDCHADYGCYITTVGGAPETRVYYQQYAGTSNTPVRFFTGTAYRNVNCPSGSTSSTTHPGNILATTMPSTGCWADFVGPGTNVNNSGNYRLNGYLVTYDIVPCPLDDLLPLTLVIFGGVGAVVLRKGLV
ncbi:hypothetical protein [Pedobacter endophyticus]|uniref:PEP-CTERM protein-sorting domain-containing protein n=1 Tax=Pedobacter endophyticus TaxID=2789740 RepID=A0A7U3Q5C3_9SPHI|nr:hypothetical protein [Pedobacter endophyticus]QPH38747.1 hypothetical protein IZT61_16980 [Pedobacter endophyticus]